MSSDLHSASNLFWCGIVAISEFREEHILPRWSSGQEPSEPPYLNLIDVRL